MRRRGPADLHGPDHDLGSRRTLIERNKPGDDPKQHKSLHDDSGELYLAFLPGGRVSISAPLGARAMDRELSAMYAWK